MSAPRSPTTLNTSRNRALDIGTDKGGFPAEPAYDAAAGTPVGWPGSGGTFKANVDSAIKPPAPAPADPKPIK
jgi:hypothetical protein